MEKDKNLYIINIDDFLYDLLKHSQIFTVFIISSLISSYIFVSFIVKPTYISSADVMIQVQTTNLDIGYDYNTAQKLLSTIAEYFQKEVVISNAIRDEIYGLNVKIPDITKGLSVTSSNISYFINISYISTDKNITKKVVDAIIDSAIKIANSDESFSSLSNKIARTSYATEGVYHSPNKLMYMLTSVFIGVILAGAVVLLKGILQNTYVKKEELERVFNLNVLGVLPEYKVKGGK